MKGDDRLEEIAFDDEWYSPEVKEMANELLALRKAREVCQHHWNVLRLVEAGGRYQYCTLCGAKKVAE